MRDLKEKHNRNAIFDIAKAIGIILMVAGHCSAPGHRLIYLFHMPLFFIISGYFFNNKYLENINSLKDVLWKKVKTLYIPFVLFSIFLILIHNFLININVYTNNEFFLQLNVKNAMGLAHYYSFSDIVKQIILAFCFYTKEQLFGTEWFLRVLFYIVTISYVAQYLVNKFKWNNIIIPISYILIAIVGSLCQNAEFNFYSIGTMFSCALLFYIGILYRTKQTQINIFDYKMFIVSFFTLISIWHFSGVKVDLVHNDYDSLLLLILTSVTGSISVLYISKLIDKIKYLNKFMTYIGQNTLSIMLYHYIGFKFVNLLQIYIWFTRLLISIFCNFVFKQHVVDIIYNYRMCCTNNTTDNFKKN